MTYSRSIDGLRGVAVLAVLAYHISSAPIGARGVDLFFCISGLCLSLGVFQKIRRNESPYFDLRAFIRSRAERIIPPFYGAILVGIIFAVCVQHRMSWNTACLEALRNGIFLSSNPLSPPLNSLFWTLLIEFRWYVYFPFFLFLYLRNKILFATAILFLWVEYTFGLTSPDIGVLPAFLFGIVAADIVTRPNVEMPWIGRLAGLVIMGAIVEQLKTPNLLVDHSDRVWHIAAFAGVLGGVTAWKRMLSFSPLVYLGRISYSVYLAQGNFIDTLLERHISPWIIAPATLLWCLAFWAVFEFPYTKHSHPARDTQTA